MARPKSTPPSATNNKKGNKRTILGKRPKSQMADSKSNGIEDHSGVRLSKRARSTRILYEAPESISSILKAVSKVIAAENSAKVTPKLSAKQTKSSEKQIPITSNTVKKTQTRKVKPKKSTNLNQKTKRIPNKKILKKSLKNITSKRTKNSKNLVVRSVPIKGKMTVARKIPTTKVNNKGKVAKMLKKTEKMSTVRNKLLSSSNKKSVSATELEPSKTATVKKRKSKKETLQPKPHVTLYDKDPTFFSNIPIPHISTIAHSRIVIRAVLNNDIKLLKQLITKTPSLICTLCVPRSPCIIPDQDAINYAIQLGNKEAIKTLLEVDHSVADKFGPYPELMMESESTGHGSAMMFGHGLRAVTIARGGKEGNAALLKDANVYNNDKTTTIQHNTVIRNIEAGVPYSTLEYLCTVSRDSESILWNWMLSSIFIAVRHGHTELAGKLVTIAIKKGGYGFNHLHEQSLNFKNEHFTEFKSVSVVKKCTDNNRITPIHCASINPNPYYLQTLLNSKAEFNILDSGNWTPMHYAAVCSGDGPLKLLLSRGITTMVIDKEGNTPIHLAVSRGRIHNVKLLLSTEQGNIDPDDTTTQGDSSLEKINKQGMRPLHLSAQKGHVEIAKILLDAGADGDKFCPAQFDKLTPLMIACQFGHIGVVKLLIERGVKIEVGDRRGRTAIVHAVINGHADVVSYLLRIGVNHETKDSSGNTLVHYAAAYGWYFSLNLLLEAGCDATVCNHWKMTPLAIAFMKGHVGIVEVLVKLGVDIDTPVDDSCGMSLLLKTCASSDLSVSLIPRLKFLVDDLKANCKKTDFANNNALHFLASHKLPSEEDRSFKEKLKNLLEAAKFLIDRGCDHSALNLKNQSPLAAASAKGNFWLVEKLMDWNFKLNLDVDEKGNTILHEIANHATNSQAKKIYEKCSKDEKAWIALKNMATMHNKSGFTPLLQVLHVHKSVSTESRPHVCHFITFLVKKLDADVNATVKNNKDGYSASVLHLAVYVNYAEEILPVILAKKPNLEILNEDLRTPLAVSILNGSSSVALANGLIAAGANVNFKSKNDWSIGLLLLIGEKQPDLYRLIPKMVEKGADVTEVNSKTRNSILHYVSRNPNSDQALEALNAIITAGADVNLTNMDGRTPLHLVVNARGKETDVSYDIEDALISAGADLSIRDNRGRTPLHYAFVKIGKPLEKSFLDPIELVMILVNSMKETNAEAAMKTPDFFFSTPLHYAAMRGSTICCSYFTTEMKGNIDIMDNNGNTPFGLSVWSGHEGCSLHFQQQGADFLKILNTNINVQIQNPEDAQKSFTAERFDRPKSSFYHSPMFESTNKSFPRAFGTKRSFQSNSDHILTWIWEHEKCQQEELDKKISDQMKYSIFQEVVKKDWQGILHLMLGRLRASGTGVIADGVSAAIKTQRLKLALKLIHRAKDVKELDQRHETLLHTLAKYSKSDEQSSLQQDVIKSLLDKGVNSLALDDCKANAIIYAAINLNYSMIEELSRGGLTIPYLSKIIPDNYGRTPFSALFWNLDKYDELSKEMTSWAASLLSNGASANILTQYPFILSPFPGVRCVVKYDKDSTAFPKYSPLITAVLHGRYKIVKWLISMRSKVDLNFGDEEGRTPLMHAVRLNDLKMVKLLLNENYNFEKDMSPWTLDYSKWKRGKLTAALDVSSRDKKGWTALDYLVCPSLQYTENIYVYKNVEPILTILYNSGASLTDTSGDNLSPLKRAIHHNRDRLVKIMYQLLKTPPNQQSNIVPIFEDLPEIKSEPGLGQVIINFSEDAQTAAEKKIDNGAMPVIKPDALLGLEPDNAVVLIDSDQGIPYDCILTKVDISYGMYGLYNFYKMQIVKEPRGKQLIFLFTQWGRVGDTGQHQKTPFTSEEEAVKEFKKIFRSKSGNNWEDVTNFKPISKKYRLLNKELTKAKKSNELKVDFDKMTNAAKKNRSVLNPVVYEVIKQLSLVHKVDNESTNTFYSYRTGFQNSENLPIVSSESLKKGDAILSNIRSLLEKKYKMSSGNPLDYSEDQKLELMDELVAQSEEFYALVPVYGFACEKLQPIFDFVALRERQEEIYKLIHLGFGKELMLAAEFNSELSNPFEYIYRCLGTKLQPLRIENEAEKIETDLLLEYIQNTSNKSVKVQGIYRVQRSKEEALTLDNRWFLWHGTNPENLLSILHNGLQVSPLGVDLSGDLFGKGIYFADMFTKSQKYSHGTTSSQSKFILLCEVALGKVHEISLETASNQASQSGRFLPPGCDSLKTLDSLYEPDPGSSVEWKGRVIPLGKKSEKHYEEDESWGLDYNEYIVFNQNQVNLRYLVQFSEIS